MLAHSLAEVALNNLNYMDSVVEDTEGIIMVAKVEVVIDLTGLTDRTSQAPMTGSTDAGISGTRRRGRQRSKRPTLSGRG